ncbi:MAG TPA: hypothetical protein VEO18_03875 [Thermoplasmata archaeon]|nr:hypothetical protein [Thermoplasmata archaeon]
MRTKSNRNGPKSLPKPRTVGIAWLVLIAVEAFIAHGHPVVNLDRDFVLPNLREFLEKMGYQQIPAAFVGLIPE